MRPIYVLVWPTELFAKERPVGRMSLEPCNGFTSFKINVLKQRFSILFLASPCSAHALLLHLSLSLIQIFSSAPTMKCSIYTLIFNWAQTDKQYRWRHCLHYNRNTCSWTEGRDVQTRTRGGLANHNTLDQLTNLSPLRISEGGAS